MWSFFFFELGLKNSTSRNIGNVFRVSVLWNTRICFQGFNIRNRKLHFLKYKNFLGGGLFLYFKLGSKSASDSCIIYHWRRYSKENFWIRVSLGPSFAEDNINIFKWRIKWYHENHLISWRFWFIDKRCYWNSWK